MRRLSNSDIVPGSMELTVSFVCHRFRQTLAKKMTVLYKLSKEQLSKQHHYDFGLRNIKAVLVRAGELKRITQDMPEDMILMKSLK